jgi:penicillin G amidase
MKKFKKVALIITVVIAVIFFLLMVIVGRIARKGLPDYSAQVAMKGLTLPVKVYRDSLGIPHIYAANEHDLYMVTGYLLAQDRLWQMDLLRRVTLGRLSEIFGDDFIETDLLLRSLEFRKKSEGLVLTGDSNINAALYAFSEGVNRYIEEHAGNYPVEFILLGYTPDRWEPVHSLNLIGYMAWDLKSGWSELLLEELASTVDSMHLSELLPHGANQRVYVFGQDNNLLSGNKLTKLKELEGLGLDIFSGSNNWAVSGARSITGQPLLANDMHLAFGIPGIWYQIHQVVEGELNVEGLLLPGQPLVIVGHNDSIAWGMTNTYVDNLDYYEEKINPADSNEYMLNGEWKKFTVHDEIILSKSGREVKCNYRTNHRGPVVSDFKKIKDRVLTIHWVGSESSSEMRSVYLADRADNWAEFRDAFSSFISISQNIVFADKQGNIGLQCAAGVPIRKRDGIHLVLPGWTDEYDWKGLVPFEELPFEYNPPRGYVSSANNRTVDSTYPYHIGTWFDLPYRMDRIRCMLNEKEKFSMDDFKRMQNDQHSEFSALFLKTILPAIEIEKPWSETKQAAYDRLKTWDFNMTVESSEASLAEFWAYYFLVSVYRDELGDKLFEQFMEVGHFSRFALYNLLTTGSSAWIDNIETEKIESLSDIASASFSNAFDTLSRLYGENTTLWNWGNIHQLTLTHPIAKVKILDKVFGLNQGPYAVGGSFHTVSPYKFPNFEPKAVVHGSSHRSIYDISNWSNSISVIPTGVSGIPSSRFYCNQSGMYVNGEYHPDFFDEAEVKERAMFESDFVPLVAE